MPTINQLIKKGRKIKTRSSKLKANECDEMLDDARTIREQIISK